ncbi:MAG TPA: DUF3465 domain-containing protein [Gemmatimonadales bacterium]|nr:DUF3465 domain-containing protein [Gemmatimonadales bacterium]
MAGLVLLALYLVRSRDGGSPPDVAPTPPSPRPSAERTAPVDAGASVAALFRSHRSNVEVETGGRVVRLLPDDRDGSPHQRFLLRVGSGTTVLVAHNLDLAQRVALAPGDSIELRGEYEWNPKGGVIHWTHPDPEGRHEGGWIVRR